jgi:hypothetical protein
MLESRPEMVVFLVPGVVFIIILGAAMQYLRSRDIKQFGLSPIAAVTNMFLIIASLVLYMFLAMVIVAKYIL